MAPAPIAVVSDNGACFRGEVFKIAFDGPEPPLRHVHGAITPDQRRHRKVVGHLEVRDRGVIANGDALEMKIHRFRIIYSTIRPHQAIGDRIPSAAYTGCAGRKPLDKRQKRALRSSAVQRSLPLARAASSVAASMSVKVPVSILSINGPTNRPSGPPRGT
jgi:putative transposase